jgi:uncharacterized oligopeptide transporter (OPT) family protein
MATPFPTSRSTAAIPAPRRELTARAVVTAVFVAAIMGASFPYVVLKIGYGPNISVVAAFFGYIALAFATAISGVASSRYENNLAEAAGTAAGQTGFMCVVLAAIDMLNARPELGFSLHLSSLQIFLWLTCAGLLGALLASTLRRHYIDEENLTFADGTAAGETLVVLYEGKKNAAAQLRALTSGMGISAFVSLLRDGPWKLIPAEIPFGAQGAALRMGSEVSVLSFGAGLLVGARVTLSMAIGMIAAWVIAPDALVSRGWVAQAAFNDVLRWVMWPATGLMVAGGLTALALKWNLIVKTFASLGAKDARGDDEFPIRWVIVGSVTMFVLLAIVQYVSLDFPLWLTVVSLLISLPLMLVGTRVLGETNWAPISALANLTQAIFAALAPGHLPINMVGSGMSGTIAGQGEHLMQDYRAAKIIGTSPRKITYLQLIGVPVGAAALSIVYPALRDRYGFTGDGALTSPISQKWAAFAELLSKGFDQLPTGALTALVVALVLGIALTLAEPKVKWAPSPTAIGLGMLIPGYAVLPMVAGGLVQAIWARANPKTETTYSTAIASGFIAGEALLVLGFAILAVFGVRF